MVVPDGWFDYPAAVNAGRRAVAAWLAANRPGSTVLHCPEGGAHCRPVPVASAELRWCHPGSLHGRDGRFFDGSQKPGGNGRSGGSHQLDCSSGLWDPFGECWVGGAGGEHGQEIDKLGASRAGAHLPFPRCLLHHTLWLAARAYSVCTAVHSDPTASHLGKLCPPRVAAGGKRFEHKLPAKLPPSGTKMEATAEDGTTLSFTLPVGASPGGLIELNF